jgi:2-hydroxy-3-oxopropionate reductase
MADLAGLKRETLYNVMSAGPLRSGMMDFIKAGAVDNNPGKMAFSIANANKDLSNIPRWPMILTCQVLFRRQLRIHWGWLRHPGMVKKMVPEMEDFIAGIFKKA